MGTSTAEATQFLTTQRNELIKAFYVYDGQSRLETVYTAGYKTGHAQPCERVDYEYLNGTSKLVTKMRESTDVWDSSYDI